MLRETIVRAELRCFRAVRGSGCPGLVRFEERAGNVGYLEAEFSQQTSDFGGFFLIKVDNDIIPQASQLDVSQAELLGCNFQSVTEILKWLLVSGNEEALDPNRQTSEDAVAPPRAAESGTARRWPKIRGMATKSGASTIRPVFASGFPECKGDNWLLTSCFGFVDLSFSPLIA